MHMSKVYNVALTPWPSLLLLPGEYSYPSEPLSRVSLPDLFNLVNNPPNPTYLLIYLNG
jgi:hypothetical protein